MFKIVLTTLSLSLLIGNLHAALKPADRSKLAKITNGFGVFLDPGNPTHVAAYKRAKAQRQETNPQWYIAEGILPAGGRVGVAAMGGMAMALPAPTGLNLDEHAVNDVPLMTRLRERSRDKIGIPARGVADFFIIPFIKANKKEPESKAELDRFIAANKTAFLDIALSFNSALMNASYKPHALREIGLLVSSLKDAEDIGDRKPFLDELSIAYTATIYRDVMATLVGVLQRQHMNNIKRFQPREAGSVYSQVVELRDRFDSMRFMREAKRSPNETVLSLISQGQERFVGIREFISAGYWFANPKRLKKISYGRNLQTLPVWFLSRYLSSCIQFTGHDRGHPEFHVQTIRKFSKGTIGSLRADRNWELFDLMKFSVPDHLVSVKNAFIYVLKTTSIREGERRAMYRDPAISFSGTTTKARRKALLAKAKDYLTRTLRDDIQRILHPPVAVAPPAAAEDFTFANLRSKWEARP